MNRTTKQLASIGFAFLLIASAFSVVQLGSAQSASQYSITQGEQCYTVSPRQGSEDVMSYYDYRNPEDDTGYGNYTYSSWGTRDLQDNQQSKLFLYQDTSTGEVSLVFVHDLLDPNNENGDRASTITMDIDHSFGGSWAVEDDDYENEDDDWNKGATSTHVNWVWAPHRTDGGAYTGLQNLGSGSMVISPSFNEEADRWGSWQYSGDSSNNYIEEWNFIRSDGSEVTLDMQQDVTITAGPCEPTTTTTTTEEPTPTTEEPTPTTEEPTSTTTEEPTSTTEKPTSTTEKPTSTTEKPTTTTEKPTTTTEKPTDEPPKADLTKSKQDYNQVHFDASGSTDDDGIVNYEWDLDGDGEFDDRSGANVTDTWPKFHASGTYTVSVRVTDTSGQTDTASVTVTIKDEEGPDINMKKLDADAKVAAGDSYTATIGGVYDPVDVKSIEWSFAGEAPSGDSSMKRVDFNTYTYSSTATHTFHEEGKKKVVIKATDGEDNVATEEFWVTVKPEDWEGDSGSVGDDDSDDGSNDGHHAKSDDDDDDSWVDVHRKAYERKQAREEAQKKAEEQKEQEEQNETTPTPTPEPTFDAAMVEVVNMKLDAKSVETGETVTIDVTVSNGNELNGTVDLALTADGEKLDSKSVKLGAKKTKTVSFEASFDEAGSVELGVDGLSKTLTVTAPTTDEKALQDETPTMQKETTNDSGQPGFGIVAALVALVAAALIARRRD